MKGLQFVAAVLAAAIAAAVPTLAMAQQSPAKVLRIALLSIPLASQWSDAIQEGLADYGYVPGKNVQFDSFIAPTTNDLPTYAAKAVADRPDLILTVGTAASQAAEQLTKTIPIVFAALSDPVGVGLVPNVAHPGGNITGSSLLAPQFAQKAIGVIRDLVPNLQRIAILNDPANQGVALNAGQAVSAASAAGLDPVQVDFDESKDFETQAELLLMRGVQAIYVPTSQYFSDHYALLYAVEIKGNLPIIFPGSVPPVYGVVAYGPNTATVYRHSGAYIDAILKGAKPGDLPIEQPTTFDFVVNLSTAKAIGITVPAQIFAQATQVIE